MRGGLTEALRQRLRRPDTRCAVYVDALVRKAEDVKATRAEWDAGTKTTVETFDDGAVRLSETATATASHTSSNAFVTDLDGARPLDILSWELAESIGAQARLTKVEVFLSRKRDGGQPTFDGDFTVQVYRIARYGRNPRWSAFDVWDPVPVGDPVRVRASEMSADSALVPFAFDGQGGRPLPLVITEVFRPTLIGPVHPGLGFGLGDWTVPGVRLNGRVLVVLVRAHGGSNTNYGLGVDNTVATDKSSSGTLRHRTAAAPSNFPTIPWWSIQDTATGMTRATLHIRTYAATGSVAYTGGNKLTLGVAAQGEVEFVDWGTTPDGTTRTVQARVSGGDPWVTVRDGQRPGDVGLAVPNPVAYEMQVLFTSNAAQDSTPTQWAMGFMDRVRYVLADPRTALARCTGFDERVDVVTGAVKMAEGRVFLQRTGVRDYQDLATRLLAENSFADIEIRLYIGHPDLAREDWLVHSICRVDDYEAHETEIELVCVSVLERLRGQFPAATGSLFGWFPKAATAHLTGGSHTADFNRELSEVAETASTLVVSVAASATEESRAVTKAGVPGLTHWPTGDWTIKVDVETGDADVFLSVAVARLNGASGADLELSEFATEQQATTGTKVFSIKNRSWQAGAAADVVGIVYRFRNNVGSVQSVTLRFGTVNGEVLAPWTPLTQVEPKVYELTTGKATWEDWRDVQIGLQERYRGPGPGNTTDRLRKTVADADGKRELERISLCLRGLTIGSQGRVKFVPWLGPELGAIESGPIIPMAEESSRSPRSPGLAGRRPQFDVPYGFDNGMRPGEFAGRYRARHTVALAAFGLSRIDDPNLVLEDETARWIPEQGLAQKVAQPIVAALAFGEMVWPVESTVPWPEAEIGDPIAAEIECFVMRNPITGEAKAGPMWAFGKIAGYLPDSVDGHALMGRRFLMWIRSVDDIWSFSDLVQRRALAEIPWVTGTVRSVAGQPENAVVHLAAYPPGTEIRYFYRGEGDPLPDRDSPLWTVYSTPVTVERHPSSDKLFSLFGKYQGFYGQFLDIRVPGDKTPEILNISMAQTGTSPNLTITATATPDADVRRIRWYRRDVNGGSPSWPTVDGTQGAALDPAFLKRESHVAVNGGSVFRDGTVGDGGVTEDGRITTGTPVVYAHTRTIAIIAVPIDVDGNAGPRKEVSFTTTAGTPASVSPLGHTLDTVGSSCFARRKYDFSWTPAGIDDTYELRLFVTINGLRFEIHVEGSPNSVTSANAVEVPCYPKSILGNLELDFDYELYNSTPTLVASGPFGTGDGFKGELCEVL